MWVDYELRCLRLPLARGGNPFFISVWFWGWGVLGTYRLCSGIFLKYADNYWVDEVIPCGPRCRAIFVSPGASAVGQRALPWGSSVLKASRGDEMDIDYATYWDSSDNKRIGVRSNIWRKEWVDDLFMPHENSGGGSLSIFGGSSNAEIAAWDLGWIG